MNAQTPLKIIDCDTHLTEPHDLWVSRAPASLRDRVPQVRDIDGVPHWVFDGDQILGTTRASCVIRPDMSKEYGTIGLNMKYHEVTPAAYSVKERLQFMDETGIYAQIVYPNLLGFGGHRAPGDEQMKTAVVKIYNDALADFQEQSGQRIFGMGVLPWWNVKECVAEIERVHKMGLRGVNMNNAPQLQGFPELMQEYWYPIYEACGDLGLPINFHIGASEEAVDWMGNVPWNSHHEDIRLAIGSSTIHMQNGNVLTNILMSDICERFPKTKFVSVESGIGWIPFMLEALDYYVSHELRPEVRSKFKELPSFYFKRQISACFWFERKNLANTVEMIGEDNVLWESDFPHPTCLYPDATGYIMESVRDLAPALQEKILTSNAARLYNIPLG